MSTTPSKRFGAAASCVCQRSCSVALPTVSRATAGIIILSILTAKPLTLDLLVAVVAAGVRLPPSVRPSLPTMS